MKPSVSLGAIYLGEGRTRFLVWAPAAEQVQVRLVSPREDLFPLQRGDRGYFFDVISGVEPGARYFYRLNNREDFPDPASRYQPQGVHGPSQVINEHFAWNDGHWCGLSLRDYIVYELHVGTFTPEGTFEAVIPHLDELKDLGITAIEIMPVAQFPGGRNWGYDGVFPFAVQNTYGGPDGLKKLVDACHQRDLAVVLDVVFNHVGPEGDYLAKYGPYFTHRYQTPWGPALNSYGPGSDDVRRFFIENAMYWFFELHVDALRLDALDTIIDLSPRPFIAELSDTIHKLQEMRNRKFYLMAESDLNDVRFFREPEAGGYGLDVHWCDDFHHALHTLLTGEQSSYYIDYGRLVQIAKAFREGFIYTWDYSPYRDHRRGSSSRDIAPERLLVFSQNHDQVGNRPGGERLTHLVSFEALKLAAASVLLSPFTPLLFMGEEYGETARFVYFVSHSDEELKAAVCHGRQREHECDGWNCESLNPCEEETFVNAKLNRHLRREGQHKTLYDFYRALIALRKELGLTVDLGRQQREVLDYEKERILWVRMIWETSEALAVFSFSNGAHTVEFPWPAGDWEKKLDSADSRWGGPGTQALETIRGQGDRTLTIAPLSAVVYLRKE
jgi:maltooligosyltrehalose trehalohydrolase